VAVFAQQEVLRGFIDILDSYPLIQRFDGCGILHFLTNVFCGGKSGDSAIDDVSRRFEDVDVDVDVLFISF
jgi:hypothetical protein